MKAGVYATRQSPFRFVLDEILPIRPTLKQIKTFSVLRFAFCLLDLKVIDHSGITCSQRKTRNVKRKTR
jgi:hypothetical protein